MREPAGSDVATSATPDQVKRVFRRARLVGRRFRIAHVRYGRHIIERPHHGGDFSRSRVLNMRSQNVNTAA